MTYEIVKVERAEMADELLDLTKQHMRVNFDTDDAYIKNCIIRAVDLVERHSGAHIFQTEVAWTPLVAGESWAYPVPVQPIASFTAMDGAVDVSAEYRLRMGTMVEPVYLIHSDQTPFPAALDVALVAGFSADTLPPQYLDPILRVAAHFYEHRESVDVSGLASIPQWMNDLLLGNWIPRA